MKTRKKETEEKNDYLDLEKEKKKTSRAEELPKSPNKGAVKRKQNYDLVFNEMFISPLLELQFHQLLKSYFGISEKKEVADLSIIMVNSATSTAT